MRSAPLAVFLLQQSIQVPPSAFAVTLAHRVFLGLPVALMVRESAAPIDVRVSDNDAARSDKNILQWMAYLPRECVKTMIVMRWDATT